MDGGPWALLAQGIQDTTGHFVGRRDRDHAEHREDHLRAEDRAYFLHDLKDQRKWDSQFLRRMKKDAMAAGIHPLAAMGAQIAGPAEAFRSQSYDKSPPQYPKYGGNLDISAMRVNDAQARKLDKEADLIQTQIDGSTQARTGQFMSNDKMAAPNEIVPQEHTPVLDHAVLGKAVKSDPTIANASSHTDRSGESEIYEALLSAVINYKDWAYDKTGVTNRDRDLKWHWENFKKELSKKLNRSKVSHQKGRKRRAMR